MMDRIRFWRKRHPFVYRLSTGAGIAVESYNPITDQVRVRVSRCGYVNGTGFWSRQFYLDTCKRYVEENDRA